MTGFFVNGSAMANTFIILCSADVFASSKKHKITVDKATQRK